jgi:hypothetical protein
MRAIALIVLFATACVTSSEEAGPSDVELQDLDTWATTADGKADLPSTWNELVAWLEDVYMNRMSAVWFNQEHPRSPSAAIDRIRGLVISAGKDPARTLYSVTVQKLSAQVEQTVTIDHSEINIALPGGQIVRLVGDPKGAGAFFDGHIFQQTVGPRLCLTWSELQTAITASYAPGAYGVDFVCHTVTERVLRALDVGTSAYSHQYRTYAAARWVWGPVVPSFNSQDPSDWDVSRRCQ